MHTAIYIKKYMYIILYVSANIYSIIRTINIHTTIHIKYICILFYMYLNIYIYNIIHTYFIHTNIYIKKYMYNFYMYIIDTYKNICYNNICSYNVCSYICV
jgi:hypothetical protein